MRKIKILLLLLFSLFIINIISFSVDKVKIEYFGREDCKNCSNLKKFLTELNRERMDFEITQFEIDKNEKDKKYFDEITTKLKLVKGTPIIYINERIIQGFNTENTTGKEIVKEIEKGKKKDKIQTLQEFVASGNYKNVSKEGAVCEVDGVCEIAPSDKEVLVTIPFTNEVLNLTDYSLPLMALILGTIDGFNPCAMWVLILFLTALLAVGNKKKMFRIVGLFILSEAIMYYLILTAWLYTWDFVGLDKIVTPIVGVVGIVGGIFFIKNFLKEGNDIECEVTDFQKRAEISKKIKDIANKPFTLVTALAIIGLALSVNVIEFACSVGIPQTFTKILQINNIGFIQRQIQTLIYIFGYMIDDFIVFSLALLSINKLQLTNKYSKWMNLIGGILMIILGIIMIFKPSWLII